MINSFDLFVVVVTAGLAILGFREGLLRGAVRLIGFIALVAALAILVGPVAVFADSVDFIPRYIMVPLFVIVFLVLGLVVIHLVSEVLHKIVHMTPAGFIDYSLGCAFGIIKALIVCGLLSIALSLAPPGGFFRTQYEESASAGRLVQFISEMIPPVKTMIQSYYRRFAPPSQKPDSNDHENRKSSKII